LEYIYTSFKQCVLRRTFGTKRDALHGEWEFVIYTGHLMLLWHWYLGCYDKLSMLFLSRR